ncbi:TIGR02328 family protein [Eupransor demetentiae]|uniref:Pyrimidine dimer DNA glycosylase n=1 Tax=Eupransor demetentiae TaxID=3109584 RepID=A0ABP0ERP5_9LACO|nr:hypothetical protein R54876_GBNLAHCA_01064 [Lactobacillaceae bacterium LMG 33000]
MRLWHQDLIEKLPRQQLLGQHRECCALRGAGWGRKHATVNYVFEYSPYHLFLFHQKVMEEMAKRGYKPDQRWLNPNYWGLKTPPYVDLKVETAEQPIYPEHDAAYLQECLDNLAGKGIDLS